MDFDLGNNRRLTAGHWGIKESERALSLFERIYLNMIQYRLLSIT